MSDAKQINEYWSNPNGNIYQDFAGDSDDIIKTAKLDISEMWSLIDSQAKQLELALKALEWYENDRNWGSIEEYGALVSDGGKTACAALSSIQSLSGGAES